jgi:hypothetical protein
MWELLAQGAVFSETTFELGSLAFFPSSTPAKS